MKSYLIINVLSLSLISLAQAAELSIKEQCLALGYNTEISECEKAGSAALLCPLNDRTTKMAVCITDSCRGYPLYKKNGKYYYLDQSGNEVEAVPSKGQLTDHMEGGFETCVAGYGDNAVTYYRVPKCKGEALYNNYFCDVGCDTVNKYPYTYHPGNTAGTVQKCVTADQTYYGYSSCNKGWVGGWLSSSGVGKCGLDDCNMLTYPYSVEPNTRYYNENRGKTETCKIGGAIYYKYRECNNTSDFVLKGSVCARKCEITNCTNTPFTHTYLNGDTAEINDWHCSISNKCAIGDIATLNAKEIGIIASIKNDQVLLIPINNTSSYTTWSDSNGCTAYITQLKDWDPTTPGKIQTTGVLLYKASSGYSFPAVEKCFNYSNVNCTHEMCKQGEWFLPSWSEIITLNANKYILSNSCGDRDLYRRDCWTSSIQYNQASYTYNIDRNAGPNPLRSNSYAIIPMLAF